MNRRQAFKKTALALGVTASASTMASLLSSCQEQERLSWTPKFFTPEEAQIVSAICEAILPETSTPGAKELKVDMFVDEMIAMTFSLNNQVLIKTGMKEFNTTCDEMFEKPFQALSEEEQKGLLKKMNGTTDQSTFYKRIRAYTLMGYYTSEYIGKNVLSYDPIPGRQEGCIPVSDVGNAWTL